MDVTEITRAKAVVIVAALLLLIYAIPVVQHARPTTIRDVESARRDMPEEASRAPVDTITRLPGSGSLQLSWFRRLILGNRKALRAMNAFEDRLEEESWLRKIISYPVQYIRARWVGLDSTQVYRGRGGWLFYGPDMILVTGPRFLDPRRLRQRAASGEEWRQAPQPDPLKAILHFKEQLDQRDIALVIVPTPVKPMIYPDKLFGGYAGRRASLKNPSSDRAIARLRKHGVLVFDPAPILAGAKAETESPLYLKADTHWTPEAMTMTARNLAGFIQEHVNLSPAGPAEYHLEPEEIHNHGDLAVMLKLTDAPGLFPKERVTIHQVLDSRNEIWQPLSSADILVLGDSFSNMYSLKPMGWGFSAGLIEHLSYYLQRSVDRIVRNDDGAFATRAILARELVRGRDRLKGKRAVVWQFAGREFAIGNWKLVDMKVGQAPPSRFFVPRDGTNIVVTGIIEAISSVPRPGRVPYKDFIMALHVSGLKQENQPLQNNEAVVYAWGMRQNKWTLTAYARPGQAIRICLRSWYGMGEEYARINRGELEDESLLLVDPCWGDVLDEEPLDESAL